MDVFLSYADSDRAFARRLADDLTQSGLSVWFDREKIEPGSNILTSLLSALRSTRVFMPLISRRTSVSPWFSSEIATALAAAEVSKDRRIVPVVIERGTEIPPFLRQFSAADLSNADQYRDSVSDLINVLKREGSNGPLPSPEMLAEYNRIVPDLSERIMRATEQQISFQSELERSYLLHRNLGFALGLSVSLISFALIMAIFYYRNLESPFAYVILIVLASNFLVLGWIAIRPMLEKRRD